MAKRLGRRGHRYHRRRGIAAAKGAVEEPRVPTPTRWEAIDSPRPPRPCRFWHSSRAPGRGAWSLGGTNPAAAPARAGLPPAHLRQPSRLTPPRPGGNGQDSGSLRGGEGKHDVWRTRFMESHMFKNDLLTAHEPGEAEGRLRRRLRLRLRLRREPRFMGSRQGEEADPAGGPSLASAS